LEALSAKFSRLGHRVLMMTEHDRGFTLERFRDYREACAQVSSAEILVVPGIEYSDATNQVHVLVWGVPFLGEGLPTGEMLEAVRAANGVAVLAHPSRRNAWASFEPYWADRLLGIEIWNRKYDGWAPSTTAPVLLRTAAVTPFVGLDFHTRRQSFPLAMALDLQADVTEHEVLQCLRSRRCSARAFGLPIGDNLFRKALPALSLAEQSRRTAAAIVRSARAFHS
jgi:hypothetical protein